MRERPLLRDPEFLKYWISHSAYGFGFPIAGLAIPLVAVSTLGAGPMEMGHQQGRMHASIRFVMWSVVPFGAVAGGFLGERIGLVPALWIGVAGTTLASLWIFLTSVRGLRVAPGAVAP